MDYLQNISWPSGSNTGSIVELRVVPIDDVTGEPTKKDDTLYGDFTFLAGKGFKLWRVASQSAGMDMSSRDEQEGISKDGSITFLIPKDRAGIRQMLELAEQDKFIVSYKDANGKTKIFGSTKRPVSFIYSRSSGKKSIEFNAYQCRFYYNGPQNEFFYDQVLPDPPAGTAPAVVRVNGTVVATLAPGEVIDFDSDFDFDFQIVGT
jgi:hypothetical protein